MATRLKVVKQACDIEVEAPSRPATPDPHESTTFMGSDFAPAPTRNQQAGWTAERQRRFIERLSLTGNVGEACAVVGLSSTSAYRLRNKAGADGFARAWDAALRLAATRGSAIAWDRALNGRVERFYKDGELVMERRIPSDYLLTWLLARLDPAAYGSPAAKAHVAATVDPREQARADMPALLASFADVSPDDCECDVPEFIDARLGEMADGKVARED